MASNRHEHRALVAGLSVGAGLVIPAAAFAATIPFDDAHAFVTSAALPFAVGSLAGVGIHALSSYGVAAHAEDLDQAAERAQARAKARSESAYTARREGVPVISRAMDAMTEEEAWADIDSLLDANRDVSCDPIRSKDIYQIALEEMARDAQEAEEAYTAAAAISATPAAAASATSAAPDTTDVFVSLAGLANAQATPVASAAETSAFMLDDLEEPEDIAPEVPMIDYTGHEDMWAAALAILEEDDAVVPVVTPASAVTSAPAPSSVVASPDATVMMTSADETFAISAERMQAMAAGGRNTEAHAHVNKLVEDEMEQVPSQSLRNQSREYLRVIQGGTMSMPLVSAEA